jgi:hypothetical protein
LKTLEKNLISLVNNPKEINKIGTLSREWIISKWNPKNLVKEYEQFYQTWLDKLRR